MISPPVRSRATTIAAVLDLLLTALFLLLAIALIVGASTARDLPIPGAASARNVFYFLGLVVIGVCVWTATIGIKLLQLKSWARIAGIVTFGGFVLLSLTSMFGPRGEEGDAGVFLTALVTAVDAAIVVLLLSRSSARDFAAQPEDLAAPET